MTDFSLTLDRAQQSTTITDTNTQHSTLSKKYSIDTNSQGIAQACQHKNFFLRTGEELLVGMKQLRDFIVNLGDSESIQKLANNRIENATGNFNQRLDFLVDKLSSKDLKAATTQFTMLRHQANLIECDTQVKDYDSLLMEGLDHKLNTLSDNELDQIEATLLTYKKADFSQKKQDYLEQVRQCVTKHQIARSPLTEQTMTKLLTALENPNVQSLATINDALAPLKSQCGKLNVPYEANLNSLLRLSLYSMAVTDGELHLLNQKLTNARAEINQSATELKAQLKSKTIDQTEYANKHNALYYQSEQMTAVHQAVHTELFLNMADNIKASPRVQNELDTQTKHEVEAGITYLKDFINTASKDEDSQSLELRARQGLQKLSLSETALKQLNLEMLNLTTEMRADPKQALGNQLKSFNAEISHISEAIRAGVRAVRHEYLLTQTNQFTDDNLSGKMRPLGKGAAHEVMQANYGDSIKVFKGDDEKLASQRGGHFIGALAIGIDHSSPRLLERAVVASRIDTLLGFNISAKTDFAQHNGKLGIVMDKAQGTVAKEIKFDANDPALKAQLQPQFIKMQLLDIITGQMDRHRGNYLIDINSQSGIAKLTAIDNDFCMGPEWESLGTDIRKDGSHLQKYPTVVDREMYQTIKQMKAEDLQQATAGLLSGDALAAAQTRLVSLQRHVETLHRLGRVIDTDQWGTDEVSQWLETPKEVAQTKAWVKDGDFVFLEQKGNNPPTIETKGLHTSYWARDQQKFN